MPCEKRAMQDDDESDRGEKEQCRHQDQPDDQQIKPAPWRIFSARIRFRRRDDRFRRRLDLLSRDEA